MKHAIKEFYSRNKQKKNTQDAHLSESCAHSLHEMFRKKKRIYANRLQGATGQHFQKRQRPVELK